MIYYLDTNVLIGYCNNISLRLKDRIRNVLPENIKIPAMVLAEIYHGAYKSQRVEENLAMYSQILSRFEIVPFDTKAAVHYGRIKAVLQNQGNIIGPNDLVIAATVRSRGGVLVTSNVGEFGRVPGLLVEDWTK
ncbi:MAG: type II toxin-antitoxin system VapC family toxin [Defluviitaleaceae bacterium]|nr:type II toxin-antitoxin system VapC family toxin [Defluviitaleaceae bacterium]